MIDLGHLLLSSLSADHRTRENATRALETAAKENLSVYLTLLSQELADTNKDSAIRQAAGVAFKNSLISRDESKQEEAGRRWLAMEPSVRNQIKHRLIGALDSKDVRAGTAAGQAVAAVASAELPQGGWPELMSILVKNSTNINENLRRCTIETIGFICEELDPEVLSGRSNEILTAVVQCLSGQEKSMAVREAAARALTNSLAFVKDNFERVNERDVIMQVVCEAATIKQAGGEAVIVAALECLVGIVQLYYQYLQPYMEAILQVTLPAIRHEEEAIALQAIEFWSTLCDRESELRVDKEEFGIEGEGAIESFDAARLAASFLVPALLDQLLHQEEDDQDEWNRAMASATCLSLLAELIRDDIIRMTDNKIMAFVEANITSPAWNKREAAIMAFGSIMDGPSEDLIKPYIMPIIPLLLTLIKDTSVAVRDTAAWALGRIVDFFPLTIPAEYFDGIVFALKDGLADAPRVAVNCCWSLMSLMVHCGDDAGAGEFEDIGEREQGTIISAYFAQVASALFICAQRPDAEVNNLRSAAYQSLANVVAAAPSDVLGSVMQLQVAVIEKMVEGQATANLIVGIDDRMLYSELQSHYCTLLQSCIKKLGCPDNTSSQQIMSCVQAIFENARAGRGSATELEDVFLLCSTLIEVMEGGFAHFLPMMMPFLCIAIGAHSETNLCGVAIGVVGDLARGLGMQLQPHCDQLMSLLIAALQSSALAREVKPHVISAIGDIALALGPMFVPYLNPTVSLLLQAASVSVSDDRDFDEIDFVCALREALLEAFTAITQAFKDDQKALQALEPSITSIIGFVEVISSDPHRTDGIVRAAIGLLGDLTSAYHESIALLLRNSPWMPIFLQYPLGMEHVCSEATQQLSRWTQSVYSKEYCCSLINLAVDYSQVHLVAVFPFPTPLLLRFPFLLAHC